MRVLIREKSLIVKEKSICISAGIGVRLYTKVCKSWSWLIRLARILLTLCSKAC